MKISQTRAFRAFWFLSLGLIILATACDYSVPLRSKGNYNIDPRALGIWAECTGNETNRLLVLPWDEKFYLILYPANSTNAMVGKVCLVKSPAGPLAQIQWLGTLQGPITSTDRVYQFARWTIQSNQLTVELLNSEVVKPEKCSTPSLLAKEIKHNLTNQMLFRQPVKFLKLQ